MAIARSLFARGASAAASLAFQAASTNLVWELGLVLWTLIGWQFTVAEYLGGVVMIVLMALLLRRFVSRDLEDAARANAQAAEHDGCHSHEHHDHSAHGSAHEPAASFRERLTSLDAWTDVAIAFRADLQMMGKEIAAGFLLAGVIAQLGTGFFDTVLALDAPALGDGARERDRRPADRGRELRLLGRQRPAGGRAVVERDDVLRACWRSCSPT